MNPGCVVIGAGISGLTAAYQLKKAGLDDVQVMIGGGQVDDQIRDYTGADAYGRDAMAAVALAKRWTGG